MKRITILEPSWDGPAHLPGNIGLVRTVQAAFPSTRLTFVGGKHQLPLLTPYLQGQLDTVSWQVSHRNEIGLLRTWHAWQRLRQLPQAALREADAVVFTSCTAAMLTAAVWSGFASKCWAMLHGNASELQGWRSRNPVQRRFDMCSALRRYVDAGGKVLVLEQRIVASLVRQHPWLAGNLHCLPHPLLVEEASSGQHTLGRPIKIGFLGGATIAKGFPEFLTLANRVSMQRPRDFEFRAIGTLPSECAGLDQSGLARQAGKSLSRAEFSAELQALDFLFTWHKDEYYGDAASGVVYDAVNMAIPVIGRHMGQLAEWEDAGMDIGYTFDHTRDAVDWLCTVETGALQARYAMQADTMGRLRETLGSAELGRILRRLLNQPTAAT